MKKELTRRIITEYYRIENKGKVKYIEETKDITFEESEEKFIPGFENKKKNKKE